MQDARAAIQCLGDAGFWQEARNPALFDPSKVLLGDVRASELRDQYFGARITGLRFMVSAFPVCSLQVESFPICIGFGICRL